MIENLVPSLEQTMDKTKEQMSKWEDSIDDIPTVNIEQYKISPEEMEIAFKDTFEEGISSLKLTANEMSEVSSEVFAATQESINTLTEKLGDKVPYFDYAEIGKSSAISAVAGGVGGSLVGGIGAIPGTIAGGVGGAVGEILSQVAKYNGASDGVAMTIQIGTELLTASGIVKLAGKGIANVAVSNADEMAVLAKKTAFDTSPKTVNTLNQGLAGSSHPITNIPFVKKVVDLPNGTKIEGVYPKFDSLYDFKMPKEYFNSKGILELSDTHQFKHVIEAASKKIDVDPAFKSLFTKQQSQMFKNGILPKEFTIHHAEDIGKYQIVNRAIHANTAHHGGAKLWTTR